MQLISALVAVIMATSALAAAPPKCKNGPHLAFDGDLGNDGVCFVTKCNAKIINNRPFETNKAKDINDCIDQCFSSGDCISCDFNKSTKQCRQFVSSRPEHVRDVNYDRATFSEGDDTPCEGL